jgi:hypothetical protein
MIVLLISDDLRPELECCGAGTRFECAYVRQPVCLALRAGLRPGQPRSNNLFAPEFVPWGPEAMSGPYGERK